MVAAWTPPKLTGRDCAWPLISMCTAVISGAANEMGSGNDELTGPGYGHAVRLYSYVTEPDTGRTVIPGLRRRPHRDPGRQERHEPRPPSDTPQAMPHPRTLPRP
jgi:hypothetical protein